MMMKPQDLLNNPANAEIYGTQPDQALLESIKEHGVLEDLIVDRDSLTVISGHQRRQAAIMAGLKEVPVKLIDLPDSAQQMVRLIESNRQRVKTKEQKAKEYSALLSAKELIAKQAQKDAGGKKKAGAKTDSSPQRKPTAKQAAASEVGMSPKTADKAKEVADAIDEAEASGDQEKADHLRAELEGKSVASAHRMVTETGQSDASKEGERLAKAPSRWVNGLISDLSSIEKRVKMALELDEKERGPELKTVARWGQEALIKIGNVKTVLKANKPDDICLTCKGKKKAKACPDCLGSGYMTKRQLEIREAV